MAEFVAFDLLRLNGADLRQRPLEKRREALKRPAANRRGAGIVFKEGLDEDGAVVFARVNWPRRHRVESGGQLL
jgi:ATP-dependent DNA ligase